MTAPATKAEQYQDLLRHAQGLLAEESDEIAVLATLAGALFHQLPHVDWAGFYRVVAPRCLKLGPYQGGHGCLTIPFDAGVCGKCAREARTQLVPDVAALPYHIACSSTTRAEIVAPILDPQGHVRAVLDLDSDTPAAFDATDVAALERLCGWLTQLYPTSASQRP